MPASVTLIGGKEFEAKAEQLTPELLKEVDGEVFAAASSWVELAALSAPRNFGFLVGGITQKKISQANYEVVSSKAYSAYMEWGTKSKVSVPADLSSYASEFQHSDISVPGAITFKEAIFAWAKRKGLPKSAWWPIYINIVRFGVKPHPYFFIHRPAVEKSLFEHIDNILKTEH